MRGRVACTLHSLLLTLLQTRRRCHLQSPKVIYHPEIVGRKLLRLPALLVLVHSDDDDTTTTATIDTPIAFQRIQPNQFSRSEQQ